MTTAPGWSAGRERVATTLLMKSAILMTGTVNVAFITRLQNGGIGNIDIPTYIYKTNILVIL